MKKVLLITRGIIRDRETRRRAMFSLVLVALGMLMAGVTLFDAPLKARPVLFLLYWFVCAWVNFSIILLALYDLVAVNRSAREERLRLRREILGENRQTGDENSHAK